MKVSKKPAYAYYNDVECDCGGSMKFTGETKLSFPSLYVWKCQTCGKLENIREAAPGIQFLKEPLDGPEPSS